MTEVRVKKLEWESADLLMWRFAIQADTEVGPYRIGWQTGDGPSYWWLGSDERSKPMSYLDAVDAAQADFERRVLSCLEMPNE